MRQSATDVQNIQKYSVDTVGGVHGLTHCRIPPLYYFECHLACPIPADLVDRTYFVLEQQATGVHCVPTFLEHHMQPSTTYSTHKIAPSLTSSLSDPPPPTTPTKLPRTSEQPCTGRGALGSTLFPLLWSQHMHARKSLTCTLSISHTRPRFSPRLLAKTAQDMFWRSWVQLCSSLQYSLSVPLATSTKSPCFLFYQLLEPRKQHSLYFPIPNPQQRSPVSALPLKRSYCSSQIHTHTYVSCSPAPNIFPKVGKPWVRLENTECITREDKCARFQAQPPNLC